MCIIVVTNVINVIYNFDKKNGLSKVIYAEKVIYLFSKISYFLNYFKKPNLLSVSCYKHGTLRASESRT